MKALVFNQYGDPDVLAMAEVPKPEINKKEILIEVKASGINPVDTYFRKGIREVKSFPHIPHFDLAGVVAETGSEVNNFQQGDRVWATNISGSAAEYTSADPSFVFPLPDNVSYEEGASLGIPSLTAHLSLFNRARLHNGENVLIYGASGAVGHAAVQLAKNAGAFVIGTAGSEAKAKMALDAGADFVIRHDLENIHEKVNNMTQNEGLDVIIDVSLSENINRDLEMLHPGGRIVAVGSPKNNSPELPWRLLNQKHASLLGILLFTAPPEILQEAAAEINLLLESGSFSPHLGKVFEVEQGAFAHKSLENGEVTGSIVLKI
ncbi:NADPH:quinone reductase [Alteribacillus sp. HJP-4]|uniref:NADPH:quinone reductase n=1 Tax=Alteribacillus sp. HJP-4 TaxID=2775394 RepID=UPI0035CCE915